jgi:hypothetical protein
MMSIRSQRHFEEEMMSIQQKTILYGAVYGAGFMGTTHLAGYHKLDHVAIVGVIDL